MAGRVCEWHLKQMEVLTAPGHIFELCVQRSPGIPESSSGNSRRFPGRRVHGGAGGRCFPLATSVERDRLEERGPSGGFHVVETDPKCQPCSPAGLGWRL